MDKNVTKPPRGGWLWTRRTYNPNKRHLSVVRPQPVPQTATMPTNTRIIPPTIQNGQNSFSTDH